MVSKDGTGGSESEYKYGLGGSESGQVKMGKFKGR